MAIYKNQMSTERGFIRRLAGIFEDLDIPIEHIPSGVDTVSVVAATRYIENRSEEITAAIEAQLHPDSVEIHDDIALIATVGCGMSMQAGVAAKLLTALAKKDINIRMIDQGSSEMNIIVGVENKDFNTAIEAIYDAFVS